MTGVGAYCYIVWAVWLRHCLNQRQDEYEFVWLRLYHLPEVVGVKSVIDYDGSLENGPVKKSK